MNTGVGYWAGSGGNIMGNDEVLFIGADRRGLSPPYMVYYI